VQLVGQFVFFCPIPQSTISGTIDFYSTQVCQLPFTHVGTWQDKVKKAPFVCLETKNNNRLILLVSHENENPLPFFWRLAGGKKKPKTLRCSLSVHLFFLV
jgi:hypothetical protein